MQKGCQPPKVSYTREWSTGFDVSLGVKAGVKYKKQYIKLMVNFMKLIMRQVVKNSNKYMRFLVILLLFFVSCSNVNIHNLSDKNIKVSIVSIRYNYMKDISLGIYRGNCVEVDLPKSQLKGDLYHGLAVLFDDGSVLKTNNIKIHNNDTIYVLDNAIYVNKKLYKTRSERWKSNL